MRLIRPTKKDGLFVCDFCGTKYTLEEAKKMMVEGTVDVTGTVKIDDSELIKGKMQLAFDAYVDDDYQRALYLLDEALEKSPNTCDGWYLKALIMKDSDMRLFDRYAKRGDEYSENTLGFMDREKFEALTKSLRNYISIGYVNTSTDRPVNVKIDDEYIQKNLKKNTAV